MRVRDRIRDVDWRRVANVAGLVVLVLVVLPFVVFAVPQLVGASHTYVVVSDSMKAEPAPVLGAGDVVFVYDTPPSEIQVGDVISYNSGAGQVTTHRVVDIRRTDRGVFFVTKGDANEEPDADPVPADAVLGTVEFHVPHLGHVIVFAGSTRGLFLLVVVPMALLALTELIDLARGVQTARADDGGAATPERGSDE